MFTEGQLEVAKVRLLAPDKKKLTVGDVDLAVKHIRLVIGDLEVKYNYQLSTKLAALDDTDGLNAAVNVAACLNELTDKQFGVGSLTGSGRSGVRVSQRDQRLEITLFMFSYLYTIPTELSSYSIQRSSGKTSSSVPSVAYPSG